MEGGGRFHIGAVVHLGWASSDGQVGGRESVDHRNDLELCSWQLASRHNSSIRTTTSWFEY